MASLGHIAVGMAVGKIAAPSAAPLPTKLKSMAIFSAISLAPDLDVIAFTLAQTIHQPCASRRQRLSGGHLANVLETPCATWLGPRLRGVSASARQLPPREPLPRSGPAAGELSGLRIPYEATWGHRGASHSLAIALLLGAITFLITQPKNPWKLALLVTTAYASHGLLDALTDGGLGSAILWPLSNARLFFPWQPIPVAPIGLGMLSPRGFYVVATELLLFAPLWGWALMSLRTSKRDKKPLQKQGVDKFKVTP